MRRWKGMVVQPNTRKTTTTTMAIDNKLDWNGKDMDKSLLVGESRLY